MSTRNPCGQLHRCRRCSMCTTAVAVRTVQESFSCQHRTGKTGIELELNSKGLYQRSGKAKNNCCFVFPCWKKREINHCHVVVLQRQLRNVQKSVMHVQSCFANLNLLFFLPFSLPSLSPLLKLPFYFRYGPNTCSHNDEKWQKPKVSDM